MKPVRILSGVFETSLNAPGFSISLCNLSAASRTTKTSMEELLELLDAPTTAVSWPNVTGPRKPADAAKQTTAATEEQSKANKGADIVCECICQ